MRKRTILALSLLSTTVVASLGDSSHQLEPSAPIVHSHDVCVLTQTPEAECRRFRLVEFADGQTERIRIVLTAQQREEAEAWWNRPENRWRR